MDETSEDVATTVTIEDEDENNPLNGQKASGNDAGPSTAEDSVNTGVGDFYSQHCEEVFSEEAAGVEHCHQHPPEKVVLDDQLEDSHNAEKDSKTANVCTICSLSFVEPSEFHLHMEKIHGQTSPKESGSQKNSEIKKERSYECPDCGKSYYMIGHYLNHQRSHTQAAKSVFSELEHLKKKSFQCELCGRNYSRASALDAHRRYHQENLVKSRNKNSGDTILTEESIPEPKPPERKKDQSTEKLFECKCGKAFSASMGLKTHQRFSRKSECSREETIDKPKKINSKFYCAECDKDFGSHLALFNHQRWHSNHSETSAKKFECEECGKSFVSSTFYFRHKRLKHSLETPAKSFLHQVCQLQKKSFECKDCGLKFSRASALHSHELLHTDVYGDAERREKENDEVKLETSLPVAWRPNEEASLVHEADEDVESYEPGDFIVQVISASESDDEPVHDVKPDLELLCESDQEMRDDGDTDTSSSVLVVKPEMGLKIVQVDFEQADEHDALLASEGKTGKRFNCPECYRWFTRSGSLSIHRMWHRIRRKRQQNPAHSAAADADEYDGSSSTVAPHCSHIQQHETHNPSDDVLNQAEELEKKVLTCAKQYIACKDCGQTFADWEQFESHWHGQALEEDESEEAPLHPGKEEDGEDSEESMDDDSDWCSKDSYLTPGAREMNYRQLYACDICGKMYTYLSSFQKHQKLHRKKAVNRPSKIPHYECSDCGMSFTRRTRLINHLSVHMPHHKPSEQKRSSDDFTHPRCDECNRDFPSIKSWMIHIDMHKEKLLWCLTCSVGFKDEESLDKHLQRHSLRQHECDVCQKSFQSSSQLKNHFATHTGAKPYECTFCGKTLSHSASIIRHQRDHFAAYFGSNAIPVDLKKSMLMRELGVKEKKTPSVTKEPQLDVVMDEMPEMTEASQLRDDAKSGDQSSWGESAGDLAESGPTAETKSESEQVQADLQLDESETEDTTMYEEEKYWDWECFECDMGFDDVKKLHSHYIQHATGELPIPQSDIDG